MADRDGTKPLLCIGGPLAGQERTVLHGNSMMEPVDPRERTSVGCGVSTDAGPVSVTYCRYHVQAISTPDGLVYFLSPADQTIMVTLGMLFRGYELSAAVTEDSPA